jgi:hypothetical protein
MTQASDGSGTSLLQGVLALVETGADDAPLGTVNIEADEADPRPSDDGRSPHCDLVVRGTDSGMPGHTTPNDTVLVPGSSGTMGLGVSGLLLMGYPSSPFSPIN